MADGGSKRKLNADSVSPEANQAKKHQGGSPPINGGDAFASLPGAQCPHCGEACLSESKAVQCDLQCWASYFVKVTSYILHITCN